MNHNALYPGAAIQYVPYQRLQMMSKHMRGDVNWSRSYYFGYYQQDGTSWQCAGVNCRGVERHHLWVHDAYKPAVRWDGYESSYGLDHHQVSSNTSAHGQLKGDGQQIYHLTAINPNELSMIQSLTTNFEKTQKERNVFTKIYNVECQHIRRSRQLCAHYYPRQR